MAGLAEPGQEITIVLRGRDYVQQSKPSGKQSFKPENFGGSTQEAALSALGWALAAAIDGGPSGDLELRVPAHFRPAVEVLLDSGAHLQATLLLYGKSLSLSFDRCTFGPLCLP